MGLYIAINILTFSKQPVVDKPLLTITDDTKLIWVWPKFVVKVMPRKQPAKLELVT